MVEYLQTQKYHSIRRDIVSATIRPAVKEDHPAITIIGFETQEIHADGYPDIFRHGVSGIPLEYFMHVIEGKDTTVFVAETDEQVVGYVFLNVHDAAPYGFLMPRRLAEISDIAVLRAFNNRGIGHQLFTASTEWAKARGATSLELQVWEFNKNAIAFYERLGMVPINRTMSLSL